MRVLKGLLLGIACLAILPASAYAQASIAGIVKDTSGAVLPGVTVEASSRHLIEEEPRGGDRRLRAVPHRRSSSRHLHR